MYRSISFPGYLEVDVLKQSCSYSCACFRSNNNLEGGAIKKSLLFQGLLSFHPGQVLRKPG